MKTKDRGWKWMWWILGAAAALQFYFVQQLIAAFAFFAIGFAAMALVIVSLYMLQVGWEMLVARIVGSEGLAGQGLPAKESARGIS
jgi:hypothetical protein